MLAWTEWGVFSIKGPTGFATLKPNTLWKGVRDMISGLDLDT